MRQLVLDITSHPLPTLDNFVPGRNGELLSALSDAVRGLSRERCLYVWGPPGAGKTHLLSAAAEAADGGLLISGDETAHFRGVEDHFTLLALDDVHRLDQAGQKALFHLCDSARSGYRRLVVSGPCPPSGLALRPDLATRLAWGLVFRLDPLSDEEKIAALRHRARERGLSMSEPALRYLLYHWRRDMPALLALLEELDRYSLQTKRPVTIPLIKHVLIGAARP
jgi:DnaA-homolog protein